VIKCDADFFAIDNLDQVYYVKGPKLTKLNQDGTLNCEFSNNLLGDITSIDVTDPLRILVYYKEMNQILFLDNKLTEIISPVVFDDLDIFSTDGACGSYQNRFWVYNDQNHRAFQYNEKRQQMQQSTSLDQIINEFSSINSLFEKGNFLYLNMKDIGVIIFDSFGSYFKTFPAKNITSFQVTRNSYYYIKDGNVMIYKFENMTESIFPVESVNKIIQIFIIKEKLYFLSGNSIQFVNLKK